MRLGQSPWEWQEGWARLGERMIAGLRPESAWVVDDHGFPKQGEDSVGVERQYGTMGKMGSCQVECDKPGSAPIRHLRPLFTSLSQMVPIPPPQKRNPLKSLEMLARQFLRRVPLVPSGIIWTSRRRASIFSTAYHLIPFLGTAASQEVGHFVSRPTRGY